MCAYKYSLKNIKRKTPDPTTQVKKQHITNSVKGLQWQLPCSSALFPSAFPPFPLPFLLSFPPFVYSFFHSVSFKEFLFFFCLHSVIL